MLEYKNNSNFIMSIDCVPAEIDLTQQNLAFNLIKEEGTDCDIPTKMLKAHFAVTEESIFCINLRMLFLQLTINMSS